MAELKTIKIEETVYHDLVILAEQHRMPIRVSVDFLAGMAIGALQKMVSHKWCGQAKHSPIAGTHSVKITADICDELEKLTEAISMSPAAAIGEAFYARRSYLSKMRGIRPEEMVECRNAAGAAREAFRLDPDKKAPREK